MPAHDELTTLDATFPKLEQADDSALMHVGGTLVLGTQPGHGTPMIGEVRDHWSYR